MKVLCQFLANALVGGVLIMMPISLAVLVLLKGAQSVGSPTRPFTTLLPGWRKRVVVQRRAQWRQRAPTIEQVGWMK